MTWRSMYSQVELNRALFQVPGLPCFPFPYILDFKAIYAIYHTYDYK